mmetsp:Transcript_8993/g.21936  ORF Transcript_8993/g.21936 Transcript_8993/m.21936 type:complete len:210 (+) Transcript_8993:712-1341(+)
MREPCVVAESVSREDAAAARRGGAQDVQAGVPGLLPRQGRARSRGSQRLSVQRQHPETKKREPEPVHHATGSGHEENASVQPTVVPVPGLRHLRGGERAFRKHWDGPEPVSGANMLEPGVPKQVRLHGECGAHDVHELPARDGAGASERCAGGPHAAQQGRDPERRASGRGEAGRHGPDHRNLPRAVRRGTERGNLLPRVQDRDPGEPH